MKSIDIEVVFNRTVGRQYNTVVAGGATEPFYRPADSECSQHRIFYREDFVSSSLHEIAHWLVAGPARLLLPDWGYWYAPDGRNHAQQQLFEQVEVKPQALEWLLHHACGLQDAGGLHFQVSLDNLGDGASDGRIFKDAVYRQACCYLRDGISVRARQTCEAFAQVFGGEYHLDRLCIAREALD